MRKMLLLLSVFICMGMVLSAAARMQKDGEQPAFANDRIKIKLTTQAKNLADLPQDLNTEKASFGIRSLDEKMDRNGGNKLKRAHRRVNDTVWEQTTGFDRWFIIMLDGSTDVHTALADFLTDPGVEDASLEYYAYTQVAPNDPYYSSNWGHNNTAQLPVYVSGSGHAGAGVGAIGWDSDAQLAWDQTQGYGSASIIIAIIDTGVDTAHPDLRLVTGYDYGDNDPDPMDDSADPGHGTSCSGIAAAIANNNLGVTGIAGGCSVMPLKIADSAGELGFTAINNALTYAADEGAHVISMSFGAEGGTGEGDIPTTDAALEYAYAAGVVMFAATANANTSAIAYPSNHNKVISVGASSPCGQRKSTSSCDGETWWGSNYGVNTQDDKESVDIMAPTILPATDITGAGNGYDTSSDYYMWFNGTSCSTPYAAGVAALILSLDPTLTPAEVWTIMKNSATDMTIDGGAGWDRYTGYGMVNAYEALNSLGSIPNPVNFSANPFSTSQVDLSWSHNSNNDNVLVAWSANGTFGTPTTGSSYDPITNNSIPGGGTVLYNGSMTNLSHTGLDPNTTYYYKAWSVRDVSKALNYSDGVGASTTTFPETTGGGTTVPVVGNIYNINQYIPIMAYYEYTYSQQIYSPALVGPAGNIIKLRFQYWNNFQATNSSNWSIYLGHTTKTDFSGTTDYIPLASLTQVYNGTFTMLGTYGWLEFTLNTPFFYDGIHNIVIAVDENSSGYHNNSEGTFWGSWSYAITPGLVYFQDGTDIDPASPSALNSGTAAFVPKVQFDMERATPIVITSFPTTWSFDETYFPPLGWVDLNTSGSTGGVWNGVTSDDVSTGGTPSMTTVGTHTGAGMASFHSYMYASGTRGILVTPPVDFQGVGSSVSFWMYRDDNATSIADLVNVHYNTSNNLSGAPILLGVVNRSYTQSPAEATAGWYQYSYNLPSGVKAIGYIIFEGVDAAALGANGYNIFIDDVTIDSEEPLPVELASFTATISTDNYVNLTWVTQTETGVQGFYVLRNDSDDLATALAVSELVPATNTSQQQTYAFTDRELQEEGTYYYWLQNSDLDGTVDFHGPVSIAYSSLGAGTPSIPLATALYPAYPNPFNPSTTLSYSLAEPSAVGIDIYNQRGQIVRSYSQDHSAAGHFSLSFDGRDSNGEPLSSGIYLYRMRAGAFSQFRKMVLCK